MRNELTQLLIDVCLDADRLDEVRSDLPGSMTRAGVAPELVQLVEHRRGSWISYAVAVSRPVPTSEEIREYVRARAAEDPAFAEQVRAEARPILERAFQVKFPPSATLEIVERDGLPDVVFTGLAGLKVFDPALPDIADADVDTDVDVDVDVDIDVDIDVDVDIDAIVVIDVDIDVDVDVDVDVDTVIVHPPNHPQGSTQWATYWNRRRAQWRAADDRRTKA